MDREKRDARLIGGAKAAKHLSQLIVRITREMPETQYQWLFTEFGHRTRSTIGPRFDLQRRCGLTDQASQRREREINGRKADFAFAEIHAYDDVLDRLAAISPHVEPVFPRRNEQIKLAAGF